MSKIIPVEVKSGKTGTLRSLHSYIDQTEIKLAVRLYSGEREFGIALATNAKYDVSSGRSRSPTKYPAG